LACSVAGSSQEEAAMAERGSVEGTGEQEDAGHFKGDEQHGWAEDVGGASDEVKQSGNRAFEGRDTQEGSKGTGPDPGAPGSGPDQAPEGVGESISRRGEDVKKQEGEEGRTDQGTKGKSERPYGTSDTDDDTGVGEQGPIDEESPNLPAGDQGG
jgi:hypothetical protein